MPKLKNSNATFWVIFKHCAHTIINLNSNISKHTLFITHTQFTQLNMNILNSNIPKITSPNSISHSKALLPTLIFQSSHHPTPTYTNFETQIKSILIFYIKYDRGSVSLHSIQKMQSWWVCISRSHASVNWELAFNVVLVDSLDKQDIDTIGVLQGFMCPKCCSGSDESAILKFFATTSEFQSVEQVHQVIQNFKL